MSAAPNDILFSCGPSPAAPLPGNEFTVEKNPPSTVDKRPVIRIDPGKVRSFASRIAKTAV